MEHIQHSERVIIGVDPHKLSATIEVVNGREQLLGSGRFTTNTAGYAGMRSYAKAWPDRVWAVEGANGAGRPLAQRLLEDGEDVVDVPAKLAARVRLFDTGHNRKTDALDAHSIAVVAVRTEGLRVLKVDGELGALRMLSDRRDALSRRRVETVNRLQALLAELLPGQAKRDITTAQAKAMLATVRPRDIAGRTRRRIAAEELAELVAVEARMKKASTELKTIVLARRSRLMDLHGVGPVVAAGPGRCWRRGPVRRPQPVRVVLMADRDRTARRLVRGAEPAPALPRREPPDKPHDPYRRGHPVAPRHRRPRLLPTQARRGQETARGPAVPQTPDLRRHLSPAPPRQGARLSHKSGARFPPRIRTPHMCPVEPLRSRRTASPT